ncbi:hypothetical protein Pmani_029376 [Petrolisthes manimaculis]|uniref:Uncharacterized protein n=1 Tax=Petrolisthes manimaculis TaxID=1843537 RepID=A0AAE1TJ16_9EUCA|nr:hypothetical protein Pmani_039762 [Petrolisthes manimaculis]KAK4298269.1 hypothetical protein Pmani_029376 [Petrolisthes manimaculis]
MPAVSNITLAEINRIYNIKPEYYNYVPFYVIITFCTIIAVVLIMVNWICSCCHEHSKYWNDPDTGNRFASLIFVRKAKQRPLDALY